MRALLLVLCLAPLAHAQAPAPAPPATTSAWREGPHRQHGPRLGLTYLSPGVVRRINEATADGDGDRIDPSIPLVSQFGWQFEFETFRTPTGAMGVAEVVPLLSALDKGIVVPSVTVLAGIRSSSGFEVGAGPNVSLTVRSSTDPITGGSAEPDVRVGLALAVGTNFRADGFNFPVSVATVLGAGGPRVSALVGFNMSSRRY